ncbi:hypothetical protein AtDm6_1209 [Acetobacter tropicalis]|uniref:Uncharacterized protein n=1 Tax=Acetobacter tropicalis TaxID=104102 RepID=A0A094YUS9_9PROT|nr:hypothetical protein AtDm6_1209 [Acetobacter tropicalis]
MLNWVAGSAARQTSAPFLPRTLFGPFGTGFSTLPTATNFQAIFRTGGQATPATPVQKEERRFSPFWPRRILYLRR